MTSATTDQLIAKLCGGLCRPTPTWNWIGEYDEIEIPPVKPYVVATGALPAAARIVARALKLRRPLSPRRRHLDRAFMLWRYIARAFKRFPYERLRFMFRDAFGLIVSEGALMNMFIRSHAGSRSKRIRRRPSPSAKVVASDETGVRIEGTNSYHWVFHCKDAVVHQPDYSRAARVVAETMNGHTPNVWISDRYSAQQKAWPPHINLFGASGARHGLCAGAWMRTICPCGSKLWFGKAFDLARDIASFAASTNRPAKARA